LAASRVKPKLASGVINLGTPTCYRLGRCSVEERAGEIAVEYDEDDMRANDVFPETFMQFLGFDPQLKELFLKVHGEIMTADWWRGIQQRLREGEVLEVLPYHRHRVRVFSSL
jgi:isocitrate dehydrogenase kinase/phosphatase